MNSHALLGRHVSLIGTVPPADDFFMVVTEKPNEDGKYLLAYASHGVHKTHEASYGDMLCEGLPYEWVRGTEPKIGAVGYHNGHKVILTEIRGPCLSPEFILYNVSNGNQTSCQPDDFLHPDDYNKCLSMGQRVIIKGKQDVCYIINYVGDGIYNVAVSPATESKWKGETANVAREDITTITPSFKPKPRFKEETGFGALVEAASFGEGGMVQAVVMSDRVQFHGTERAGDGFAQGVVALPDGKLSYLPLYLTGKYN